VDLGDGAAWRGWRGAGFWGGALGRRVLLRAEPIVGPPPDPVARALLEALAAGEALRQVLGLPPRAYDFTL
jgi:hypothetical protein